MTVASYGFLDKCSMKVTHLLPVGGRTVSELIMEVTYTDVGLVKLADAERFSNVTFQSESISESTWLKRLGNSPDTGSLEGSFMRSSIQRIPVDDHSAPEQLWAFAVWVYMGQGSASTLPDGMCGSALWTSKGESGVMNDWCVGIAADELIKRGYKLVNRTES
ncbi:hypothetical protein OIDMADRAFT_102604 [Oidiodendron maius Zn]|uniref:Uncharacterized protein n=1 Tax=Oidiodendron maius (strain Zn) TaxID=913774 RepID=A0A0C3DKC5_OIDMZ|nr:hypothetical protein OIDMADRAFT_102604 [Oidiodendron maius Zn]